MSTSDPAAQLKPCQSLSSSSSESIRTQWTPFLSEGVPLNLPRRKRISKHAWKQTYVYKKTIIHVHMKNNVHVKTYIIMWKTNVFTWKHIYMFTYTNMLAYACKNTIISMQELSWQCKICNMLQISFCNMTLEYLMY